MVSPSCRQHVSMMRAGTAVGIMVAQRYALPNVTDTAIDGLETIKSFEEEHRKK